MRVRLGLIDRVRRLARRQAPAPPAPVTPAAAPRHAVRGRGLHGPSSSGP